MVDKKILRTVINNGANINIMPESTIQKLGLAITHPSFYSIKIADQALVKPMERIKDLTVKIRGVDYQVNFEVLPMRRSISTVLNEEAYPLILGRGFLRQCASVVDWSTKKPTFTYGPPSNRTQVLIEPKVEKNEVNLRQGTTTDPNGLLKVSTSTEPITKIVPHPKIKSFGCRLYEFADEDGTFAQWLIENPYSDDKCSSPIVQMMKGLKIHDPNLDKDILGVATILDSRSKIKVPDSSNPFNLETMQPDPQDMAKESSLVTEAVSHTTKRLKIIEIIAALEESEITIDQLISLKLEDGEESSNKAGRKVTSQKHKIMVYKAASPRKVAMKASKSRSELLKEAWRIKTKVAAQARKCFKAVKRMSDLAPSSKVILSFEDWQLKRPDKGHVRDRHLRMPMIDEDISNSGSIHYEE